MLDLHIKLKLTLADNVIGCQRATLPVEMCNLVCMYDWRSLVLYFFLNNSIIMIFMNSTSQALYCTFYKLLHPAVCLAMFELKYLHH